MWNTSKDLVTAYSDSAQEAGPMWSYRNQVTNTGRTRIGFMVGKKLHLPQESKISWLEGPGTYERKSICSKMLCLCLQGRRRWSTRVQQQRGTGLYSPGLYCTGTMVVGRNSARHTMAKMRACVQLFAMLRWAKRNISLGSNFAQRYWNKYKRNEKIWGKNN